MSRILIVEDQPRIAEIASDYLRRAGHDTEVAGDGVRALAAVRARPPDLVVLDLGLPKLDGTEVARAIRHDPQHSDLPIIMLTARVEEEDRLYGLEIGADDYVTKPFSPRELVARVRAVLRRSERRPREPGTLKAGALAIDVPAMTVRRDGRPIELTPTEFRLLAVLAAHPGRVHTRAQLLDAVRPEEAEPFDRVIDSHVKNLRRKLEVEDGPRVIESVYGIGYRLADD
jgi:two-component system response regulator BaeR